MKYVCDVGDWEYDEEKGYPKVVLNQGPVRGWTGRFWMSVASFVGKDQSPVEDKCMADRIIPIEKNCEIDIVWTLVSLVPMFLTV